MSHASEVFEFARAIEANGRDFYQAMAASARQPEIQQLFARLAREGRATYPRFYSISATGYPL